MTLNSLNKVPVNNSSLKVVHSSTPFITHLAIQLIQLLCRFKIEIHRSKIIEIHS